MHKKLKSWLIGIFLFFVLLFIFLRLIILFWLNPVVDKVLKQAVSVYSDGLYQISYDQLRIRPLERKLVIEDFNLDFDSIRVQKDTSFRQHIFVKASGKEIEIGIEDLKDLIFNRYLKVRQLFLISPQVSLYNYGDSLSTGGSEPFNAYALIEDYFDSLHVQYVDIKDAGFTLNNISGKPFSAFSLDHVNATIINMVVDSGTVYRNLGYPKAEQFTLIVQNAQYTLPDSLHGISVGQASFYPVLNSVVLSEVAFTPQYDKQQFARTLGYQKDWISMTAARMELSGIDLHKLMVDNLVDVQKLSVDSLSIDAFRDRTLPPGPKKNSLLLREALHAINIPFKVDTVTVKNAAVLYEEQALPSGNPGEVSFDRIFASIYHTTNIDTLSHQSVMEADVQAYFMDKSLLKVRFDFALDSRNDWHSIRGHLNELPLEVMNKIIEPTAFTSIQSGTAHALEFELEATDEQATGTVMFEYTDLKVALLNKESPEEDPKLKQKVGTVIANWFVVKTHNPNQNQPLREGIISYAREPGMPIFSYWTQALLSGLKVSVGIEKEPEMEDQGLDSEEQKNDDEEKEKKGFLKRLFKKKKG